MAARGPGVPATLGHFRIVEKIGAGGMGEVYRAHDERLNRDVALKVLPAGSFADAMARERLLREARAAAALNHPSICTVHEVGEANGEAYIAMELIEGRPLSARLAEGALATEEVLRYGQQVAAALAHAHERGVVHRDLKPANVVIAPEDRAKVLDFGLAKRLDGEDLLEAVTRSEPSLTRPGTLVGTFPYMSPEQLRAQPADARSDVWAMGVMLYEMVSAMRPFQALSAFALSSQILSDPPAPLPGKVPVALRAVIERCLEKEPGRRYQQGAELKAALEAVQARTLPPWTAWRYQFARHRRLTLITAALLLVLAVVSGLALRPRLRPSATPIRSIAVLPLANLSGDPQQDYFADGMTEELITNLAKIASLKVISRSSVMQYKGTRKPAAQIGKELNVDALIEGSVLREGGQVRITAQLIRAATDQNLWAESYQRDLRSVLALQGEIAGAIAVKVRAALTPAERTRLASVRLVNPEAYDAYLKGMQHWYKLTPQEIDIALHYFELALQKDPNYASAYAGIAMVWLGRQQMGYTAPREAGPKARAAALKAIALDDALAEARRALAGMRVWGEWDWAGGEAEFKRAIELNPNDADARASYSHLLMCMKRPEEALAQIERAMELDALNEFNRAFYGVELGITGRYDEAIAQFRKVLATSPELPFAQWGLAEALFQKGRYEESLAEVEASYARDRELQQALRQGYAQGGYRRAMRRAADTMSARALKGYVPSLDVAVLYAWAGEEEQALKWLEKGFEVHDPNMPYIGVDPLWDSLRSKPRFQALLRRLNLPQ